MTYFLRLLNSATANLGAIKPQGPDQRFSTLQPGVIDAPGGQSPTDPQGSWGQWAPPTFPNGGTTPPPKPGKVAASWESPLVSAVAPTTFPQLPPGTYLPPRLVPPLPIEEPTIPPPSEETATHPPLPTPDTSIQPPPTGSQTEPPSPEQVPEPELAIDEDFPVLPASGLKKALFWTKQHKKSIAIGAVVFLAIGVGTSVLRKVLSPGITKGVGASGNTTSSWPNCVKFRRGRCLEWSDGWKPRGLQGSPKRRKGQASKRR